MTRKPPVGSPADTGTDKATIRALRAELARSERMRRAFEDVILTVGSSLGLQELLDRVVGLVNAAVQSSGAYVYLWDREAERLVMRAATEGAQRPYLNAIQLRLGEGVTGWAAYERRPVIVESDPLKDPRFKYLSELKEEQFKSGLVVPILLADDEVVGVFSLWSANEGHFTKEHLSVIAEVSSLLAGVIEKARLNEEAGRRARVLSFLGDLCARLSSPLPTEELMDAVAGTTVEVMESHVCVIVLLDPNEGRFVLKGMAPARADIRAEVDGSESVSAEGIFRQLALLLPGRFEEAASAPLLAGADHLGFISCYRQGRFSSQDRELLSLIAGQVALGLRAVGLNAVTSEGGAAGELLGLLASGKRDAAAASVAAALGINLTKPHVLVQARFLPANLDNGSEALGERVRAAAADFVRTTSELNPHSVLHRFAGGVVGLVRVADLQGAAVLQRRLQEVGDDLAGRLAVSISVGLSSVRTRPTGYADAYREAAEALEIGAKVRGEGNVVRFDELGPYVYLFRMASDPRMARDPWMRNLLPLIEYDNRKRTGLLETLDAYLECRGNATLTADRLHLHRNTLRQRLARIEALIGMNLAETQDWLPLHFAVKLARLREGPG